MKSFSAICPRKKARPRLVRRSQIPPKEEGVRAAPRAHGSGGRRCLPCAVCESSNPERRGDIVQRAYRTGRIGMTLVWRTARLGEQRRRQLLRRWGGPGFSGPVASPTHAETRSQPYLNHHVDGVCPAVLSSAEHSERTDSVAAPLAPRRAADTLDRRDALEPGDG